MSPLRAAALTALIGLSAACQTIIHPRAIEAPQLALASTASDYDSYRLARVGVLPVGGSSLTPEEVRELQAICFAEFSERVGYELVLLGEDDLAEIEASEPVLTGVYKPETISGISHRYRLDGLLVPTVSNRKSYPPQKLNMQVDLVAAETGMTIWSSSVAIQGDRPDVRTGIEAFYGNGLPMTDDSWRTALLSPSQFARFGIWQLARAL